MQPYLFFHFQDRAIYRLETEIDEPTALIRAQILMTNRKKGSPPIKLEKLLPDRRGKRKKEAAAKAQPWQQQLAIVRVLHDFYAKSFAEDAKLKKPKKEKP